MNTYTLKRIDDTLYVSVEPLIKDIRKAVYDLQQLDTNDFNDKDMELLNLKIKGLVTIHGFLHSLLQEEFLQNKRNQNV